MKNLIAILSILLILLGCGDPTEKEFGKPNFVWIISEDNSKHYLKLFDENGISTPQIEDLARHGILFKRAFSNAPVCSTARSTLISSCYGPRIGAQYHRKSRIVPMPDGVDMFPTYLRRAGYYTTNNKKEDYNIIKNEGVWDESSEKAHWKNRAPGQPFFHKQSYGQSHEGRLHFKEDLLKTYVPVTDPDEVFLNPNHPNTEMFRFTAAYYRDKMLVIDTIVGNVVKQLKEDGLLESTFIFYFGDNGGVLPGSKGYIYETGLHVPLVIRIPEKFQHLVDIKPGSSTDGFVSFVDFGPTLLELAGAEIPSGIDGRAFLGEGIKIRDLAERDITFGYADRFDEKYDLVRSVRKGKYKYMRNYQPFNPDALHNNFRYRSLAYLEWREMYDLGVLNEIQEHFFKPRPPEELFDIEEDPYETRNLAKDPALRETLHEMRELLVDWVKGMPDLSFYPENELIKNAFDNPVEFGKAHREYIEELVDIADLSLLPYEQAESGIGEALNSEDPWKKYWGLIVCSSFGRDASDFYDQARNLTSDDNLLVRTRAAEFLGLTGAEDPGEVLTGVLRETMDPVEANLVLNTVVLLRDGPHQYNFNIREDMFSPEVLEGQYVQRRLQYLLQSQ